MLAPANTAQIHDIPQAVKANVNPPVSFHVVVDGQQRLTTLILIISSLRTINQHNCDADHNKWEGPRKANENLLNKFLVSKETGMTTDSDVYLQRFSVKNENTARWQPFANPKKAFHKDKFADGHHVRSSQFFLNFDALNKAMRAKFIDVGVVRFDKIAKFITFLQTNVNVVRVNAENDTWALYVFNVINSPGVPIDAVSRARFVILAELTDAQQLDDRERVNHKWEPLETSLREKAGRVQDVGGTVGDEASYYDALRL